MTMSVALFGLLVLVDVLFILNYVFVERLVYCCYEPEQTEKEGSGADGENEETGVSSSEDKIKETSTSEDVSEDSSTGLSGEPQEGTGEPKFLGKVKAIFGIFHCEPSSVDTFVGWNPKPFYYGRISTCLTIVVSTLLLALPDLFFQAGYLGLSPDFCTEADSETKLEDFRVDIYNMTNLDLARKQANHTEIFNGALKRDVTLYGTSNHTCPPIGNVTGRKDDWVETVENGPFFPGYCERAQEEAIKLARNAMCTETKCGCPTIIGIPCCTWPCGRICFESPFACPRQTDDEEEDLKNYQEIQRRRAEEERRLNETRFPTSTTSDSATALVEKLFFQIDVASYVYTGYALIAIFLPAPIQLLRLPMEFLFKDILFGTKKIQFISFIVAAWWGIEYFQSFSIDPKFQLYLENLRLGNPCVLDTEYTDNRQKLINDVCEELVPTANRFKTSALTIQHTLAELEFFVDPCNCAFPGVNLAPLASPGFINITDAQDIHYQFENNSALCGNETQCNIAVPRNDFAFLGNASLCLDPEAIHNLVLEPPEAKANWWTVWFGSGIMAKLVIKLAIVNFGLALFRYADPLSVCGGRFEWTPKLNVERLDAYVKEFEDEVKVKKERAAENEKNSMDKRVTFTGGQRNIQYEEPKDVKKQALVKAWRENESLCGETEKILVKAKTLPQEAEEAQRKCLQAPATKYLQVSARSSLLAWSILNLFCTLNLAIVAGKGEETEGMTVGIVLIVVSLFVIAPLGLFLIRKYVEVPWLRTWIEKGKLEVEVANGTLLGRVFGRFNCLKID